MSAIKGARYPKELSEEQIALILKHGNPDEFADACMKACDDLFITPAECAKAIQDYQRQFVLARKNRLSSRVPPVGWDSYRKSDGGV